MFLPLCDSNDIFRSSRALQIRWVPTFYKRFVPTGLQSKKLAICYQNFKSHHLSGMAQSFAPGDDLIFQLESGYGLLRVLAVEGQGPQTVWHLLAYEEFYPTVEAAERALTQTDSLTVRRAHMALTDRAFERTPPALLGNRALSEQELAPYHQWLQSGQRDVSDRSALLMLGIR